MCGGGGGGGGGGVRFADFLIFLKYPMKKKYIKYIISIFIGY